MTYFITIPDWRPTCLNELMHRHPAAANRLKKADRELVHIYALLAGVPGHGGRKRRVALRITLPPKRKQLDIDALQKSTLDALVWAGLLKDDTAAYCQWDGVVYSSGVRLSTVLVISDCDDAARR